jgi:hypothetical protein
VRHRAACTALPQSTLTASITGDIKMSDRNMGDKKKGGRKMGDKKIRGQE